MPRPTARALCIGATIGNVIAAAWLVLHDEFWPAIIALGLALAALMASRAFRAVT